MCIERGGSVMCVRERGERERERRKRKKRTIVTCYLSLKSIYSGVHGGGGIVRTGEVGAHGWMLHMGGFCAMGNILLPPTWVHFASIN